VRSYGALLAHRDARWPLLTSTVARITPGMIVLAIIFLLRDGGYSYTAAGVVTAAHQIGIGVGSPVQGRWVDRFGQRRVLRPDAVLYLTGTVVLAMLVGRGAPVALLAGVAVVTGLVFPPVTACARVLLSGLFPSGNLREAAFALTAIAVELGFIVGPLAAVVLRSSLGGAGAVVVAGVIAAVGAIGYAATDAVTRVPRRDAATRSGSALRAGGVRLMVVTFGFVAVAFGVLDVVVPAVAEFAGRPEAAGLLIASIASGSLIGGAVYGARVWPGTAVTRLRVLSSVFAVGLLAIPLSSGSLPVFAAGLFVGGLFLGPTTICAFQLIDDLALPGTQTEAQAWTQSSIVFGVAFGASLAGVAVDAGGPGRAFVVGALCVGVAAAIVHLGHDRLRHTLRGSEAAPVDGPAALTPPPVRPGPVTSPVAGPVTPPVAGPVTPPVAGPAAVPAPAPPPGT
jgi:MFS family permease